MSDNLMSKWGPVLDHPDLDKIQDSHKRHVVAQLLENQRLEQSDGHSTLAPLAHASPVCRM